MEPKRLDLALQQQLMHNKVYGPGLESNTWSLQTSGFSSDSKFFFLHIFLMKIETIAQR